MADFDGGFNAEEEKYESEFEPLPAGDYTIVVTASELKETAKKNGTQLVLGLEVVDGDLKGRKFRDYIMYTHESEIAQKIGRGRLSSLCEAVGVLSPRSSEELHNRPAIVVVACKKQDDGTIRNEVKKYKSIGGETTKPTGPSNMPGATKAPWKK